MEKLFFFGFEHDFSVDPAAEQFPEGKIVGNPFFLGFGRDFSMFWEIKITWKIRFSLVLGWPGAGPAGVWGGFGNPGLIPHLWNAPKWDFPQNSLFWKGFSPLLPLELGWGKMNFFFWGGGKSQILGSGAAGN